MNQLVYDLAKVLHIIGIVAAAGISLIDFILFRYFRKVYALNTGEGVVVEGILRRLQRVMAVGMMLIVISGVMMMFYLHAVWGQQLWFRIKIGVLVLIIINGLLFRRRLGNRIHASSASRHEWGHALRVSVTAAQIVQLVLFVIIFTLSIFKFN